MTRLSAFATHLGISFVIFVFLAYLVVFEWYPGILFDTDGGWRGMQIIFAVDLVLGPLLTLAVFKPGKPGLKTDMTLIGLLQTVCLVAGTYVVWVEKPAAMIYMDGRFQATTEQDFIDNGFTGVPDLSHIEGDDPKWILVEIPTEIEELAAFRRKMFAEKLTPIAALDRYVAFSTTHPQFVDGARDITRHLEEERYRKAVDAFVLEHGSIDQYKFYLFTTRYVFTYAAYDQEGNFIDVLDLPARGVSDSDASDQAPQ